MDRVAMMRWGWMACVHDGGFRNRCSSGGLRDVDRLSVWDHGGWSVGFEDEVVEGLMVVLLRYRDSGGVRRRQGRRAPVGWMGIGSTGGLSLECFGKVAQPWQGCFSN